MLLINWIHCTLFKPISDLTRRRESILKLKIMDLRMKKINWGILSTAKIGVKKVIPEIMKSDLCNIYAIASRDHNIAKKVAEELGIEKSFGTYEELLSDPKIDAIYNPLPNNLHIPLTIEAIKKGKHVLCEKPISLDANEAQLLIDTMKNHPKIKVMEAFMYLFHPQWVEVMDIISQNGLGEVKFIETHFSYFNDNPKDIRNKLEMGGGALLDIGCYPISLSRNIFKEVPKKVYASGNKHPTFGTDTLITGILEFSKGRSVFTCSTMMAPYQNVRIFGEKDYIEINKPFNPSTEQESMYHYKQKKILKPSLQYAIQFDIFSKSIINDEEVPISLIDSYQNMKVIDALFKSFNSNRWENV